MVDLLCESVGCDRLGTRPWNDRVVCARCHEELDGQLGLGRRTAATLTLIAGMTVLGAVLWSLATTGPGLDAGRIWTLWAGIAVGLVVLVVAARLGHKENR